MLVVLSLAFLRVYALEKRHADTEFGITFSTVYAQELGLDWRLAYTAMLDDLGVEKFRIPLYWSQIQADMDVYDFDDIDWMIQEAEARDVELILAIGRKVPRWPECFIPDWAEYMHTVYQEQALLDYLRVVIDRYDDSGAVVGWQIENEPFFPFGICPTPSRDLFEQEIDLARKLTTKPIIVTASGENESWFEHVFSADRLGVSLYRVTWDDIFGHFVYPLGPEVYQGKAALVDLFVDDVFISELQAEPWFPGPIHDIPISEQVNLFTPAQLVENANFARETRMREAYFWGAEWWWYLALHGETDLWETAKQYFE